MKWFGHQHEWGKWKRTQKGDITNAYPPFYTRTVTGKILVQERVCKTCGKIEINSEQISL